MIQSPSPSPFGDTIPYLPPIETGFPQDISTGNINETVFVPMHPGATTPVTDKECVICFSSGAILECGNSKHVYCKTCFEGMIKSQCETSNIAQWMQQDGRVKCSLCDYIFCDQYLAKKISPEVYEIYKRSVEKFIEQKIHKEVREELSKEFEQRLKQVPDTQTESDRHVRYIIENFLTLKCPCCKIAFHKFDGCLSVRCQSCNMDFCGTGCDYYSRDAHNHIRNGCKYIRGLYLDQRNIILIQNKVKGEKINNYLGQFDSKLRSDICRKLEKHITEREIKQEYLKTNHNHGLTPLQQPVYSGSIGRSSRQYNTKVTGGMNNNFEDPDPQDLFEKYTFNNNIIKFTPHCERIIKYVK